MLYVGKAKNLKNRLNSYRHTKLSLKIAEMTSKAVYLNYAILESELQALLVEAALINLHQPPYNTLLKDDKSPLYILLTKEEFPRVLMMRKRNLDKIKYQGQFFGPFPSAYKVKQILKLIRPILPWCNAPRKKNMRRCLENHLQLCPGVCTGKISATDYHKIIVNLANFLAGKSSLVSANLKKQMWQAANEAEFEKAARLRDQLVMIKEITQKNYRLKNDLYLPNLNQIKSQQALLMLRRLLRQYLSLPKAYPLERIEAYDVSNTSGKLAVVSQVVFTNGVSDPNSYRLFNIKTLDTPNDFAMLKEALLRRSQHRDWPEPNLLLIDGGKGQVRAVLTALWQTAWQKIPVIGLAKDPDRIVIPQKVSLTGLTNKLKIDWQVLSLSGENLALQLLEQLRDEAHRFGKKAHVKRRHQAIFSS